MEKRIKIKRRQVMGGRRAEGSGRRMTRARRSVATGGACAQAGSFFSHFFFFFLSLFYKNEQRERRASWSWGLVRARTQRERERERHSGRRRPRAFAALGDSVIYHQVVRAGGGSLRVHLDQ